MNPSPLLHQVLPAGILLLTLNRPQQRNALNLELLTALMVALEVGELADVKVVVLSGADSAFSAGADLKERQGMSPEQRSQHTQKICAACDRLADCPVPVIAAISGFCLAGGAELALACDMRLASLDAVFGFPEIGLGIFPGAGGPVRLAQLVGSGRANRLLYTGERISAEQALQIGLVDEVRPNALECALTRAERIAQAPACAVRALKAAQIEARGLSPREAIAAMGRFRRSLDDSQHYQERLEAFGKDE